MEVVILGSGTGTPTILRNASGLLIRIENKNLLFDSGPGTVRKLLEIGVTYHDIDYIFYSHFHTDHTLDLAYFLFAAKYQLSLRTRDLHIIGHYGIKRFYENLLNLYDDVIKPIHYRLDFSEIGEQNLDFNSYNIRTLKMQHNPESLGYRVEAGDKVVVYSGDTDVCDNIIELGQNADLLILDCSFPNEMKVKGHLIPQEAAQIAQAANCKRLMLTHLYPVCQENEIYKQAKRTFKGEVIVAQDLMRIGF